jgi:hypothetical protein
MKHGLVVPASKSKTYITIYYVNVPMYLNKTTLKLLRTDDGISMLFSY